MNFSPQTFEDHDLSVQEWKGDNDFSTTHISSVHLHVKEEMTSLFFSENLWHEMNNFKPPAPAVQ